MPPIYAKVSSIFANDLVISNLSLDFLKWILAYWLLLVTEKVCLLACSTTLAPESSDLSAQGKAELSV